MENYLESEMESFNKCDMICIGAYSRPRLPAGGRALVVYGQFYSRGHYNCRKGVAVAGDMPHLFFTRSPTTFTSVLYLTEI